MGECTVKMCIVKSAPCSRQSPPPHTYNHNALQVLLGGLLVAVLVPDQLVYHGQLVERQRLDVPESVLLQQLLRQ